MKYLDNTSDTFPVGLIGTPFYEVYQALRSVASSVWAVDPNVWRAGAAWGWYALNSPDVLENFRDVATAALVSSFAPMVKDWQTDAELVEYLRQWREYKPTFTALQNIYSLFGVTADIEPISDPESQTILPISDTRLAFYVKITGIDFSRPLSLSDAKEIAVRATPLGSRPCPYYSIESNIQVGTGAAVCECLTRVDNDTIAEVPSPSLYHTIDTLDGTDTALNNAQDMATIDKGGAMFDGERSVVALNNAQGMATIDKGGAMFDGERSVENLAYTYGFNTIETV